MISVRVILALLCLSGSIGLLHAQGNKSPLIGPFVTYSGPSCKVTTASCRRIMVNEFFDKLLEDSGVRFSPAPEVDFNKCMMIAIFTGESESITSVEAVSFEEGKTEIVLKIVRVISLSRKSKTTAWVYFLLPRSDKKIIIQDRKRKSDGDLVDSWSVVAELPPKSCKDILREPK